jgi:hypothetical protein
MQACLSSPVMMIHLYSVIQVTQILHLSPRGGKLNREPNPVRSHKDADFSPENKKATELDMPPFKLKGRTLVVGNCEYTNTVIAQLRYGPCSIPPPYCRIPAPLGTGRLFEWCVHHVTHWFEKTRK